MIRPAVVIGVVVIAVVVAFAAGMAYASISPQTSGDVAMLGLDTMTPATAALRGPPTATMELAAVPGPGETNLMTSPVAQNDTKEATRLVKTTYVVALGLQVRESVGTEVVHTA